MKQTAALTVAGALLALAACGGGGGGTSGGGADHAGIVIDATSHESYVHYAVENGTLTRVEPADPAASTEWDIAFRRTSIVLNGGVTGPGSVQGALAATPAGVYADDDTPVVSVLTNDMSGLALDTFGAVTTGEGLDFIEDGNTAAIDGWYNYDFMTHTVSAADDRYWIIRSGTGDSYAVVRVTDLVQSGHAMSAVTVGVAVQGVADSAFGSEQVHDVDLSAGEAVCFDIDAAPPAPGACAGSAWDLRFEPGFAIFLNSGVHGGGAGAAFGPLSAVEAADFVDGQSVPVWTPDTSGGVFTGFPWYEYGLLGGHKLWPNGRVYVIDDGTSRHKLQILSYYDTNGTAGHFLVRVAEL